MFWLELSVVMSKRHRMSQTFKFIPPLLLSFNYPKTLCVFVVGRLRRDVCGEKWMLSQLRTDKREAFSLKLCRKSFSRFCVLLLFSTVEIKHVNRDHQRNAKDKQTAKKELLINSQIDITTAAVVSSIFSPAQPAYEYLQNAVNLSKFPSRSVYLRDERQRQAICRGLREAPDGMIKRLRGDELVLARARVNVVSFAEVPTTFPCSCSTFALRSLLISMLSERENRSNINRLQCE